MTFYNAFYELNCFPQNEDLCNEIDDYISDHEEDYPVLSEFGYYASEWFWSSYNGEDVIAEMISLSAIFPNVHFILSIDDIEEDEKYKVHFKGGLHQICQGIITYEEPDPEIFS